MSYKIDYTKQKERYLSKSNLEESTKDVFMRVYKNAQRAEMQEQTDLCNFSREQVKNMLLMYNSRSKAYLRVVCNFFDNYTAWCYEEKLIEVQGYQNWYQYNLSYPIIDEVLPAELLTQKLINFNDLLNYIEKIVDPVNKFLLYASWSGIKGENFDELVYLSMNDLDESNMTLKLSTGRVITVDKLFVELMKNANSAQIYNKDNTTNLNSDLLRYGQSKYVFKVCNARKDNEIWNNTAILRRFAVMKKQTDNKFLNFTMVYKNGLLDFIESRFQEKGLTLEDALFKPDDRTKFYMYSNEVDSLIKEFGSSETSRSLRMYLKDIIEYIAE